MPGQAFSSVKLSIALNSSTADPVNFAALILRLSLSQKKLNAVHLSPIPDVLNTSYYF